MTRTFWKTALGLGLACLALPTDVLAGRGGGGYGGGGMNRGGYGGGGMNRGGYSGEGGMGHSPSFSTPRPPSGDQHGAENRGQSGNSASASGNRNTSNYQNAGAAAAGAGAANRNQPNHSNAGAAAAGAGAANRNQPNHSNAGAAAAGADAANRNQPNHSNAGAAAAGADAANRNQPNHSNAGAAAAGADYANRNQPNYSNAGAAAAGADYANRNKSNYPNAGVAAGAAAGAAYSNNRYNQYHPGMVNGAWNGNYGGWGNGVGYGGVGAWGTGSPAYGYGYSNYTNPYVPGYGGPAQAAQPQPAQANASPNYAQPINTAAPMPDQAQANPAATAFDQARDAFKAGDYANAQQLTQQALKSMPNDATIHEFLALVLFALGKYDQAAAPLYAVLSVGPGWDWTTLSGNYAEIDTYTKQLRALEDYARANPKSASARFLLTYHYISMGHTQAAIDELKALSKLTPDDKLAAQLLRQLQPDAAMSPDAPAVAASSPPADAGTLAGNWVAPAPGNVKISLAIRDGGGFTWTVSPPGQAPTTIAGTSTLADGVLTLAGKEGPLAGQVAFQDKDHFTFRLVGAPGDDPGLKFSR